MVSSQASQFDGLVKFAQAHLSRADLSAQQRDRLSKDLAELAKGMQSVRERAGAIFSVTFRSERGSEGYGYDYGKHPYLDGLKPLTLLNHVGGSPLFAMITRSRSGREGYENIVKVLRVAHQYFEEFALPKVNAEIKAKIEQITKAVQPLLQR